MSSVVADPPPIKSQKPAAAEELALFHRTLGELCRDLEVSRQAVSKHLNILEEANLVVTRWSGREKRHYLNPVPIQEISDRWISRFAADRVAAITALKNALEEDDE